MAMTARAPRLPTNLLVTFDVDCGDGLLPGHVLFARGLVDEGRSQDDLTSRDHSANVDCQMVSLSYELRPGVTRTEAAQHPDEQSFTVDATYDADVPLPWSTGGSGPQGLPGPATVETYDESLWGGESTIGELGPWPVPAGARHLTFWLHPADGGPPVGTLTVDLTSGSAAWSAP